MKTKQELYAARPTSPHLEIYRQPLSAILSILHRLTGIALFAAISVITWWMILWIMSDFQNCYLECISCSCLIKYALYILSFVGFYHTCTGIRHLVWDAGYGFSIKATNFGSLLSIILAASLTSGFWILIIK